jgi:FtsH-binding integral membrane protein
MEQPRVVEEKDQEAGAVRPIWFKRKTYGWGWTPSAWQGWAVLGIYTGALVTLVGRIDTESEPTQGTLAGFFLPLIGLTLILLVTTYLTGEKPRWQWGKDEREK